MNLDLTNSRCIKSTRKLGTKKGRELFWRRVVNNVVVKRLWEAGLRCLVRPQVIAPTEVTADDEFGAKLQPYP